MTLNRWTCHMLIAAIGVCAIAAAACTDSPTSPSPSTAAGADPEPGPAPSPGPEAPRPGALSVTIVPNPVPWSGEPVSGCDLPNTWFYDQVLKNVGGMSVTVSDRTDSFDGVEVSSRSGLGIVLGPGAEFTITTRWCSANNIEHITHTSFSGSDDAGARVTLTGPDVHLLPTS